MSAARAGVSIVIPVLNEAAILEANLRSLGSHDAEEVIVVDGGSSDRTVDIAESCSATVLHIASPGRARQLNAGARAARGEIVLFLHADVRLPADAIESIRSAMKRPSAVGGAFRTRTVLDSHTQKNRWIKPMLPIADIRSRYTSTPYGDQAMFVRRAVWESVGGFPDVPLLEDAELSRKLARVGELVRLRSHVRVSARRYAARPLYYTLANNLLPLLHRVGVPPTTLASWYRPER